MDIPVPPQDEELRNIIEKLAVFVARNGQEFEAMTKQKQRNNPRFAFLFGGEFYNYYMCRVTTEQAILKHKATREQHGPPGNFGPPNFSNPGGMLNQQQQPRFPGHQQMFDQPRGSLPMQGFDRGGFDTRPPINFERHVGPGPGGMQNFERPPINRMPFQPRGPTNFGGPGGFERPPQVGNFERSPQGGNFERSAQGVNFERSSPGNFERPPQGGNFDRPSPTGNFERPPQGGSFDRPSPTGNFERPPQTGGFERPPQTGSFDRPPQTGGFERPPQTGSFERPPQTGSFERPPQTGSFERPPQTGSFERPPQSGNGSGSSLDVDQRQNFQAPSASFDRVAPQSFPQNFSPQAQTPVVTAAPSITPPAPTINLEALQTQKKALEEQIRQSEQNLAGQHQVLLTQQQKQIEESIRIMQDADIQTLAAELNVNLEEFDAVLQPIVESCTKDAISSGKAWIFTHTPTKRHYQLVSQYLLRKTTDPDAAFNKRLHIIYLVNDVLHHCMRKGADDLQAVLENMVIPMYCHAKVSEMSSQENTERLDKLLTLWESKSSYVSSTAVEKLRNFNTTWQDYQTELLQRFAGIVTQIAASINQTYEGYQNQHQLFCQHVNQNIKAMEQQIQQALVQQQLQIQQQQQQLQLQQQIQLQQQQQQQQLANRPPGIPPVIPNIPPGMGPGPAPLIGSPASQQIGLPNVQGVAPQMFTGYPNQGQIPGQGFPPPIHGPPGMELQGPPVPGMFDLSKPPPGFGAPITPPPEADLIPKIEYYELPAGLMVPLVKPEDDNYKPVDPKAIRLPPPCPPSDRLLQAVEAFYAPATHERPRDSEGWERLGLYEYFKSKNLARKQKEDDIRDGRRLKSRSPTPIKRELSPTTTRSPPRRRYQSKSPTPPRRRRSRSRSPPPGRRKRNSRRSRSRSRSPEPLRRRSPTPPSFTTAGLGMEKKLDETNKGHQLLKKMGWSGSGLGRDEQGIEAPISGGELRDKKDQYRGVGISTMNDPFESYRKSKGQAFVERMRARAEERL